MKTEVRMGDRHRAKNNEIINIEYQGNTTACICITDDEDIRKYPITTVRGLCTGCPLDPSFCAMWLSFCKSHRVIPLEELVE